ncbi:MAG: 50S ribosomal protein L25 [Halobacteriovoraceae bacterium]|nr:50S ribosomal protein L25 [Halobacteriovoraceae bacterium]|tara:strand:+ start:1421 stop:2086 length:666 start_codon:yes stop_codon:yes gene_type:complete
MSDVLTTEKRELKFSKGDLDKFRAEGKVPGVVYGKGMDSVPVFVDYLAFRDTYNKNGKIFELDVAGKKILVNTKLIDTTVFGKTTHINFHKLKRGEKTTVKVPLELVGEAAGKKEGGMIQQIRDVIQVAAAPKDIPNSIEVDISGMNIGDSLSFGDLKLASGLELIDEAELAVVTCTMPKQQAEEEVTEGDLDPEAVPATEQGGDEAAAEGSDDNDEKSEA